jgi:hypothetical protein
MHGTGMPPHVLGIEKGPCRQGCSARRPRTPRRGSTSMNTAEPVRELTVVRAEPEAEGVLGITLADPGGGPLPEWEPGAHIDVELPSGMVRSYSLCGRPGDRDTYRIAVLRVADGRGGSEELHTTRLVSRRLTVRGPRNQFPLVPAPGTCSSRAASASHGGRMTAAPPSPRYRCRPGSASASLVGAKDQTEAVFASPESSYGRSRSGHRSRPDHREQAQGFDSVARHLSRERSPHSTHLNGETPSQGPVTERPAHQGGCSVSAVRRSMTAPGKGVARPAS